jgi:hypothetical protein
MLIDRASHVGWRAPTAHQAKRSLASAHPLHAIMLPPAAPSADNSPLCIDLDQGAQGSCTANAHAQTLAMKLAHERLDVFTPARRANYWWNRNLDGNTAEDCGATVGGAFEVGAVMGVPSEIVCPYDDKVFEAKPGPEVDQDAFDRKGKLQVNYFPILSGSAFVDTVERVLTSGRGIAFGVAVTEAFCATLPGGIVQLPRSSDRIAGGHALTAVGFDRAGRWLRIKNSWGPWGEPGQPAGCFRMSYEYFESADDLWFVGLSTGGL